MTEFSYLDIACSHCHKKTTLTVANGNPATKEHSWYDCPACHTEVDVMLSGRVIWAGERLISENAAQRLRFLEAVDAAIHHGRQTLARF
jgi:NAD-dependent SIR2 family protein deacetylase